MEPPRGLGASLWQFIRFLPFFAGLLLLGILKGVVFCPLVCLFMIIGNSALILGLWPAHFFWTYYCTVRAKQVGPVLKIVLCPCIFALLILWPLVGILASIVGGALYGFLSPVFATFDAVGEGKTDEFYHCLYDGTWSTILGCFTVVRDFKDVLFHSYFSYMDDLRSRGPPDAKYYEIKILYLPGALLGGVLGILVDVPVISLLAIFKGPYMLFKGWQRLLHDLIGREGPFLETICVPFAGLAILLWPLAVAGAIMGSMVSSVFLGAFSGVVAYQESSFVMGLRYIVAALAIFDEYSNDILDMPEGTCFPSPYYRKKDASEKTLTHATSFSKNNTFQKFPSRSASFRNPMSELKPFEFLEDLFKECCRQGQMLCSDGAVAVKDIEEAKSRKNNDGLVSIGLPAYCILQMLIRSAKANSPGLLLSDSVTEITSTNRPKETFFDWFLNPLLIIKEQIRAENLGESEEGYLGKLVLFGDHKEKSSYMGNPPESEVRKAELEALARRLRGITKSISRYPTYRRRFEAFLKLVLETLSGKNGESQSTNGGRSGPKRKGSLVRFLSERSFKKKTDGSSDSDSGGKRVERDVEIQ